jgi:hypothetical protein
MIVAPVPVSPHEKSAAVKDPEVAKARAGAEWPASTATKSVSAAANAITAGFMERLGVISVY